MGCRLCRQPAAGRCEADRCSLKRGACHRPAFSSQLRTPSASRVILSSRAHQIRSGTCLSDTSSRRINSCRTARARSGSRRAVACASSLRTSASGSLRASTTNDSRSSRTFDSVGFKSRTVHDRTGASGWASRSRAHSPSIPAIRFAVHNASSASGPRSSRASRRNRGTID